MKAIQGIDTPAARALIAAMTNGVSWGGTLRVLFIGEHVALVLIPGSKFWSSIGCQSWSPTKVMRRGVLGAKTVNPNGWFPPEHPASETFVFEGGKDGRITQKKVDALIAAAKDFDWAYPALLKKWKKEEDR